MYIYELIAVRYWIFSSRLVLINYLFIIWDIFPYDYTLDIGMALTNSPIPRT